MAMGVLGQLSRLAFPLHNTRIHIEYHELPGYAACNANDISMCKNTCVVRQRHRRDSLPQKIATKGVIDKLEDDDESISDEDVFLDDDDDIDTDDQRHPREDYAPFPTAKLYLHSTPAQPGRSELRYYVPTLQPYTQRKYPLRELCVKIRETIDSETVQRPGWILVLLQATFPA
jgi:hypothetical protein